MQMKPYKLEVVSLMEDKRAQKAALTRRKYLQPQSIFAAIATHKFVNNTMTDLQVQKFFNVRHV